MQNIFFDNNQNFISNLRQFKFKVKLMLNYKQASGGENL